MKSSDEHFDSDDWVYARWSRQNKIMPVDFINGYGAELPIRPATTRAASTPRFNAATPDSLDTTAAFQSAQKPAPQARPEKIARAAELLADPNYPSTKELDRLAGFLAGKL